MDRAEPKAAIREQALALGFDAVGFAEARLAPEAKAGLTDFLAQGYHGDMGWLADKADRRGDPTVLWPEARSVVVLGLNYGPADDPRMLADHPDRGAISVYARNRDYHEVMKKRLRVLARWMHESLGCEVKLFVDTAPVMEKPLAAQAGLGWQGKHTNLVSREFGSWLLLGEVYTTLALEPDPPAAERCGSCRACQDVCPTAAFPEPFRLDARRCISYLTIEHKGHIAAEFRRAIGNRIYGCDDCLAVCPWNKFAAAARETRLAALAGADSPPLSELLALDDAAFRRRFAGTPVKRTGRDRVMRNALIAAGNSGDAGLVPAVERLLDDASPLVRAMAVWALQRLAEPEAWGEARRRRVGREPDADVRAEWEAPAG